MEAHGFWIHPAKVYLTILPPVFVAEMNREEKKQFPIFLHDKIQKELEKQINE